MMMMMMAVGSPGFQKPETVWSDIRLTRQRVCSTGDRRGFVATTSPRCGIHENYSHNCCSSCVP